MAGLDPAIHLGHDGGGYWYELGGNAVITTNLENYPPMKIKVSPPFK
jgi:hypothetical protein